jgi:hypothetical protein
MIEIVKYGPDGAGPCTTVECLLTASVEASRVFLLNEQMHQAAHQDMNHYGDYGAYGEYGDYGMEGGPGTYPNPYGDYGMEGGPGTYPNPATGEFDYPKDGTTGTDGEYYPKDGTSTTDYPKDGTTTKPEGSAFRRRL